LILLTVVIQDQQAAELPHKAIAIEAYEAAALGRAPRNPDDPVTCSPPSWPSLSCWRLRSTEWRPWRGPGLTASSALCPTTGRQCSIR